MADVKYTTRYSPEQRIARRLMNSGEGACPDVVVKRGEGPTRAFHNIHESGSAKQLRRDDDEGR
jgi:hypothetical protein